MLIVRNKLKWAFIFLGGIDALLCILIWGMTLQALCVFCLTITLLIIAYRDMQTMKISNGLILAVGVIDLCAIPIFPDISIPSRVVGLVCVSVPVYIINLLLPEGFGGGDIKLLAVCGFFTGWECIVLAFVIAMAAAGVWCLCMMLVRKMTRKSKLPLGPFICGGVIVAVFLMSLAVASFL